MSNARVVLGGLAVLAATLLPASAAASPLPPPSPVAAAPSCAYCDDYAEGTSAGSVVTAWRVGAGYETSTAQSCVYCDDYREAPVAVIASTWKPPQGGRDPRLQVRWALASWRFW